MCPDEIEMIDTLEYGRRPRFKDGALVNSDRLAMQVCPGIELTRAPKPGDQLGDQRFFDAWGPVLGVWEGYAADSQIRFEGSSGGVATALSLFGLERLGMHGVLHVRSRSGVPYLNQTALSRTREELLAGAGSRYAPASPCDGLEQIEQAAEPCVFVGKPCDVAALRKAMELRPSLHEKVGLSVAFFCAGTPSIRGTLEMMRQMGIKDPTSVVSLRYRGCGWPGVATVTFKTPESGEQRRELTYDKSWGDILQKYRQWRCYICPDHIGEFADIAVADAWHRPVLENQPGLSVMVARTMRGKEILEQAVLEGFLDVEEVGPEILPLCRPDQAAHQGGLWARVQTLGFMGLPTPHYRGFSLFGLWISDLSIRQKIRSVLSTIKRVFVKKLYQSRSMVSYPCFSACDDEHRCEIKE
jgi:coenzyme F420 hydrogenase subunit beta